MNMFQPIRRFLILAALLLVGMLSLPHLSSAQSVVSDDPNFTPSVLKSGLSVPSGLVFRSPSDLVLSQNGANQISLVNATTGAVTSFATQASADEIAVRSSDGLVAVKTQGTGQNAGPINFYDSTGNFLNSIPQGTPNGCITGLAFDASGNLFVAAGPGTVVPGGCQANGVWHLYRFSGPTPWTATPTSPVTFTAGEVIEGLAFSAAPLSEGSLYAVSSTSGKVYQIVLCSDCSTLFANPFAQVTTIINDSGNPVPGIAGVAIDPLLGDIYISEFNAGAVLRVPPPDNMSDSSVPETPTIFATGFANTFGLAFDTNGNLYVNETNAGNLWKFSRNSFATDQKPITQGQTNTLKFTNPNPAMSDQTQSIVIPPSAGFCDPSGHCAAFLQDIFVPVAKTTLDARLLLGSQGDSAFFGGGPVPAGTTCIPIPSASPNPTVPTNCLVIIQKCYDTNHKPFNICPVQEPSGSTDLIQLKSKFAGPLLDPTTTAFLIDFDTPPDNTTLTDITMGVSADPTGAGGTKGICSQTFLAKRGPTLGQDFSLAISPSTLSLPGSSSATVTVTPANGFSSPVTLGVSDIPSGVTASLSSTSVTPGVTPGNSSTLNVSVGPSGPTSNFTLIVTGTDALTSVVRLASVDVNVCHYASIALSPTSVARGGRVTVTSALRSCTSTRQIIQIQFTLTGPFNPGSCGTSKSVMFTTPPFPLPAGTNQMFSFPFFVPKHACAGSFTVAVTTFVNGTAVDTSAATLTVTP